VHSTAKSYPSRTPEKTGRWVGVASHQGDALTYLILTDDTQKVIARSAVRSATDPKNHNLRADRPESDGGEVVNDKPILYNTTDLSASDISPSELRLPSFAPDELLNQTFVRETDDGRKFRARVVRQIQEIDESNRKKIRFLVELGDGEVDEIVDYNTLSDLIERQQSTDKEDSERLWCIHRISGHQGPLGTNDPRYKGSMYNALVEWDDGSSTYEPLSILLKDDPITLAQYAVDNDMLDKPGWKALQRFTRREKLFKRMSKQAKMSHDRHAPTYMFGLLVPKGVNQALAIDKKNGDKLWERAMQEEIDQLHEYSTFKDMGSGDVKMPSDYQRIRCHFVFAVKHDGRHKARFVAGGHMTQALLEGSSYSSVVSIRSLRLALLAAELNGLSTWAGDIGNAYLEAYTREKVYFVAGPEFRDLEGHTLVVSKALYGLRTSGARFHDRLIDTLRAMKFFACKADPDLWIRDCGNHYEYICVYVDDLAVMMVDPKTFFDELAGPTWNFKLKGVGPITYHLGANFSRDPDGTLGMCAKGYVKRLLANFEKMFDGEKPKECSSPLDKSDHPELDTTEELPIDKIKIYQSLIGALQWAVTLGRFDIFAAVMTLGRFRAAPRLGHLERLKRICGYLRRHPDGTIRFRTGTPDHQNYKTPVQDWQYTFYRGEKEELPSDMPKPKGKPVKLTTFVDANLLHDLTTGRSATGVIHLVNQTPIEWYSKRQSTVETSTYGSEFVAARLATEQIMDLRYNLRMMGIPIDGPTYMFGDNASVVTSGTIPHSTLSKRHVALAYHRVREAVATGVIIFLHIEGKENPADILTKFLPHTVFWPFVRPLLFWRGDTGSDTQVSSSRGVSGGNCESSHGPKRSRDTNGVEQETGTG
jgi:hypothetical protein